MLKNRLLKNKNNYQELFGNIIFNSKLSFDRAFFGPKYNFAKYLF